MKGAKKTLTPTEYQEQSTFVDWLELRGYRFTAIPNSTYTHSYNQKRRNHFSGLRPGIPDILIILPKVGLLFIEMKRAKPKGKLTSEQAEWIAELNKLPGVQAEVCHGPEEAIALVERLTNSKS